MYSIEYVWYQINRLFIHIKKCLKITASERIKYRKVSAGEKK